MATPKTDPALKTLREAAKGLQYVSETDAPMRAFVWPRDEVIAGKDGPAAASGPLTEAVLRAYRKVPEGTKIAEGGDVDAFFRPVATPQDWHDDQEKKSAQGFQELVKALKSTLSDLKVFRVGEIDIDAYVVGRTKDGNFAGVSTRLVET